MMGNRQTAFVLFLLALLACVPAVADEQENEESSSVTLESPDYSEEALLELLRTEDVEVDVYADRVEARWDNWTFSWIPFLLPLTLNDTAGSAQINEPVNGLTLLGVDYPLAGPAGDELPPTDLTWRERMFRKKMISRVNAANRRDNE